MFTNLLFLKSLQLITLILLPGYITSCKTSEKQDVRQLDQGIPMTPSGEGIDRPADLVDRNNSLSLAEEIQTEINNIRSLCASMASSLNPEEKKFCEQVKSASDEALSAFLGESQS